MNIFQNFSNYIFIENEKDIKIMESFGSHNLKIGNIISKPSLKSNTYIVQPLDTIKTIAEKTKKSEEEVLKILNGKSIFIGQKIHF